MSSLTEISEIDKNFIINTHINKDNIIFYDAKNKPFKIYGVFHSNGKYRRMDEAAAKNVSDEVYRRHTRTAGGRVRFVTDSSYIAISLPTGC